MSTQKSSRYHLFLLILAGESIFILPFVLARIFRPTVLELYRIDNVELGYCFSVYGVVAMFSYLFGGLIADRFAPRKLMSIGLWLTAFGGILFAQYPGYTVLKILYGYWGFTSIFLFWAPMIKATRMVGGKNSQGRAFGFLDGGRGMVGVMFGILGAVVAFLYLEDDQGLYSPSKGKEMFSLIIYATSAIIVLIGLLVWRFMKLDEEALRENSLEKIQLSQVGKVLRLPSVLLLMLIILCAYVGYKITDVFTLYASDIIGYDKIETTIIGILIFLIRPIVGFIIGVLADRTALIWSLLVSFLLAALGSVFFALGLLTSSAIVFFFISTALVAAGVYGARALYFAVMEKGRIPLVLTGTAVGLISLIGYTPDIFVGPLIGYFLDNYPGMEGHQYVFALLILFSLMGAGATFLYQKFYGRQ